MSLSKTFKSITILGLGATLLLTGCSNSDAPQEERITSAKESTTPAEKPTEEQPEKKSEEKVEKVSPEQEAKEIAEAYSQYVSALYSVDYEAVFGVLDSHMANPVEATDEVAQQRVDELIAVTPEVWSAVNLETLDPQTRYAYVSAMVNMGAMYTQNQSRFEGTLDVNQIRVDGDKASVSTPGIIVSLDGEKIDTSDPSLQAPDLQFEKRDGKWTINPIGVEAVTGSGGDTAF